MNSHLQDKGILATAAYRREKRKMKKQDGGLSSKPTSTSTFASVKGTLILQFIRKDIITEKIH